MPSPELEVRDLGGGDPVVFVQTALTADELLPLAEHPALDGYRRVVYHRRGYTGSSPADGPGSILLDAADCAALVAGLGLDRAHLVGFSYSGAVALQVAASHPERVRTLTLIEPPPVHTSYAREFRAANDRLVEIREESGPDVALDEFQSRVMGRDWLEATEALLPGASSQMRRDAVTFFDSDLPALLTWEFGTDDAGTIACPVLHVGGSASGPWFAAVRELMLAWFPGATDVVIEGADHGLPLTHTDEVAAALARFLATQPS